VTALVVRAIDQDAAHAGVAHLSEGDLLRAGWDRHGATDARPKAPVHCQLRHEPKKAVSKNVV
jgi:hypothetical protein